MDLVYHVMKSPLILSDQIRPGSRSKMDLRFTLKLCKIRKSTRFDGHQDDTDAIINSIIASKESQQFSARNQRIYYLFNRKENEVKKPGLIRAAIILILMMILPLCAGTAEDLIPPSPEPPNDTVVRPTPVPTAEPTETFVDHIHQPMLYPRFYFQNKKKLLEIWFPNIKDGDSAILTYDGDVWMIDCGDMKHGKQVAALLRQIGAERVGRLFISHLHHDHVLGLSDASGAADIEEVLICFPITLTDSGQKLKWATDRLRIPVSEYRDGDRFRMGDGAVELLMLKNNETILDMNNQSAVTRITYGNCTILFTADMEQPGQEAMLNRVGPELLKCDIVKYPHHGKSDLYTPFYEAMGARMAVVTSVEGRGDPGQIALAARGLPAAYTCMEDRYVHLVTDGEYWLCETVQIK